MSIRLDRVRAVLLSAALCAGCTAPLVLAEEPDIDAPLVPSVPATDAAGDGGGDPPVISDVDGGRKDAGAGSEDGGYVGPNNETDAAGSSKPDTGVKDASGD